MNFVNFRENIHSKSPQMYFEQSVFPEFLYGKTK